MELLKTFSHHFDCPYAKDWIVKGPERAMQDYETRRRRKLATITIDGHCTYTNAFTNTPTCTEYRSGAWTVEGMTAACTSSGANAVVVTTTGEGCPITEQSAGYCVNTDGKTAILLEFSAMANTCASLKMACSSFMQGTFTGYGECSDTGSDGSSAATPPANSGSGGGGGPGDYAAGGPPPSADVRCLIAPGAIGAAHQAGFSNGYLSTGCPGTPAEKSPYMWPLRWTAISESKSMEFGSDRVKYHTKGRAFYRLDKNWKRGDTYYQEGISNFPFSPDERDGESKIDGAPTTKHSTVLHRGTRMVFLEWSDTRTTDSPYTDDNLDDITSCSWLDLGVIGNIRPDWFMDNRGDSTDVQYLGNQHIYHPRTGYNDTAYEGGPRLVKQWRKKDFANQYFVMSMMANPEVMDGVDDETGEVVHWPSMLNIPGEGFGDDNLRYYHRHAMLPDDETTDDLFLLDERYMARGGECPQRVSQDNNITVDGPPVGQMEHIPSNLEVDPNSWVSIVHTFSPIWQPPNTTTSTFPYPMPNDDTANNRYRAKTQPDPELTVESCRNPTTSRVELTLTFHDRYETVIPYLALGFRATEECLMTPRGGDDGEMILLTSPHVHDDIPSMTTTSSSKMTMATNAPEGGEVMVYHGPLPQSAKRFQPEDDLLSSMYGNLTPLYETMGFSDVMMVRDVEGGMVRLRFERELEGVPEKMHLTYARGGAPVLGYHRTRVCFEVVEFPECPQQGEDDISFVDGGDAIDESIMGVDPQKLDEDMSAAVMTADGASFVMGFLTMASVYAGIFL